MAGFCREDILMEDNDILVVHKARGYGSAECADGTDGSGACAAELFGEADKGGNTGTGADSDSISGGRSPARSAGCRACWCFDEKQRRRRKTGTAGEDGTN